MLSVECIETALTSKSRSSNDKSNKELYPPSPSLLPPKIFCLLREEGTSAGVGWVTCAPYSPAALSVTSLLTLLSTAVSVSPGACSVRSPARRRLEKVSRCSGP